MFLRPVSWFLMENSAYATDCLPSIIQHNLEPKLEPHAGEKLGKKPADICLVLGQSPNPTSNHVSSLPR